VDDGGPVAEDQFGEPTSNPFLTVGQIENPSWVQVTIEWVIEEERR